MSELKLFIDANVLISGMVFEGNEARLLDEAWGKHSLYTSADCIEEILRVMAKKFPEYMELVESFIVALGILIIPRTDYVDDLESHDTVRDKNDRHVLAGAVNSNCEFIITGDNDLLSMNEYRGIKIMNAGSYLRSNPE